MMYETWHASDDISIKNFFIQIGMKAKILQKNKKDYCTEN